MTPTAHCWPVVGRSRERRVLSDALRSGGEVVVVLGATGLGKTVLAAEVASRARTEGRELMVVSGSGDNWVREPPKPRSRAMVIVVDDAHLVDDRQLVTLMSAALAQESTVVLCAASGEREVPAFGGFAAARVQRLLLDPFDQKDISDLLASLVDGWVDPALPQLVSSDTAGRPDLVRLLVEQLLLQKALLTSNGVVRLRPHTPLPVCPDALMSLEEELEDPEIDDALKLLVACPAAPLSVVQLVLEDDSLVALERRRLISVGDSEAELISVAPPILERALRDRYQAEFPRVLRELEVASESVGAETYLARVRSELRCPSGTVRSGVVAPSAVPSRERAWLAGTGGEHASTDRSPAPAVRSPSLEAVIADAKTQVSAGHPRLALESLDRVTLIAPEDVWLRAELVVTGAVCALLDCDVVDARRRAMSAYRTAVADANRWAQARAAVVQAVLCLVSQDQEGAVRWATLARDEPIESPLAAYAGDWIHSAARESALPDGPTGQVLDDLLCTLLDILATTARRSGQAPLAESTQASRPMEVAHRTLVELVSAMIAEPDDERHAQRLMELELGWLAGARTPKSSEEVGLTDREREVALLAAAGAASKEIAAELGISRRSVDNTLQRVYRKLGVKRRFDLRHHPALTRPGGPE